MRKIRFALVGAAVFAISLIIGGCSKQAGPGAGNNQAARPGQAAATADQSGAQPASASGTQQPAAPAQAPPPRQFTLAAGTAIPVRTITPLSTKTAKAGDAFEASLREPVTVDGYVVAPRGATVRGKVTLSDPGGRVKGVASLSVVLVSVNDSGGEPIAIRTQPVSQEAKKSKGEDAAKVGIGAGVGAAIGAFAGGGRGAAIGAGAGGAAGTGLVLATRGEPAELPSETAITFRLAARVTVTEKK